MTSHRPFTSLFDNPSASPHLPPIHGISIPHARPEVPLSVRSTTSEQQRVIKAVSERIPGSGPKSHQSEGVEMSGSKSTHSEGLEVQIARDKVKTFLNDLASEEIFQNVNLQSLLKEIVITPQEEY